VRLFNEVILEEQIYLFNVSEIIASIVKKNKKSKENNRIRTGWFEKEINDTFVLFFKKNMRQKTQLHLKPQVKFVSNDNRP
jgi:hypothetical protein